MRRIACALVPLAATLLGGCGTYANFKQEGCKNARVYGGVMYDVKSIEEWGAARPLGSETDPQRGAGTLVGYGLIGLDFPLSAIADTITLPITVPLAIWGDPKPAPSPTPPPTPPTVVGPPIAVPNAVPPVVPPATAPNAQPIVPVAPVPPGPPSGIVPQPAPPAAGGPVIGRPGLP